MRCLINIFIKELYDYSFSGRLYLSIVLISLVVPALVLGGIHNLQAQREQESRVRAIYMSARPSNAPYSALKYRSLLIPDAYQIMNAGVLPALRRDFVLSRRDFPIPTGKEATEEATQDYFAFADLRVLYQLIFPLIAIAFSFSAVSGEREQGTLRMLCAYSVPRRHVIYGKMMAGLLLSLILVAYSQILIILILSIGRVDLPLHASLRLAAYYALNVMWTFFFFLLGLLCSTLLLDSAWSLTFALLGWMCIVFVAPGLVSEAVSSVSLDNSPYYRYYQIAPLYGRFFRNAQEFAAKEIDFDFATKLEKAMATASEYSQTAINLDLLFYSSDGSMAIRSRDPAILKRLEDNLKAYLMADAATGRQIADLQLSSFIRLAQAYDKMCLYGAVLPTIAYDDISSRLAGTDVSTYAGAVSRIAKSKEEWFRSVEADRRYLTMNYFITGAKPQLMEAGSNMLQVPITPSTGSQREIWCAAVLSLELLLLASAGIVRFSYIDPR